MKNRIAASFRDPSGFVFIENGEFFRQINKSCFVDFNLLHSTGLYEKLSHNSLLISYEIVSENDEFKVIKPFRIPYISYPYEWSFNQYTDAAILTLDLTLIALEYGMILKDASAYNIQFDGTRPVFIDTLSFTKYKENTPWVAYGQFCRHFLAPLALMAYRDLRLNQLMRVHIDGIPLDIVSALLPYKTKFNLALSLHIHAHAKQQSVHATDMDGKAKNIFIPKRSLIAILNNLRTTIERLNKRKTDTEWVRYYENMLNYSDEAIEIKNTILRDMLRKINPRVVCDIGANTGRFSAVSAEIADLTIAYDKDMEVVDQHYCSLKAADKKGILPLVTDILNPSPAIGWELSERMSIFERGRFDCVMALAVIHHICISGNLPLEMVARFFTRLGEHLIIEFVPKSDSQVKKLLSTREDIFPYYTKEGFEQAFLRYYDIVEISHITGSERTMYLMQYRP